MRKIDLDCLAIDEPVGPRPFSAEWWQSEEIRRLKMKALSGSGGHCERCGEAGKLYPRMVLAGYKAVDDGLPLKPEHFECICGRCLDIEKGKIR